MENEFLSFYIEGEAFHHLLRRDNEHNLDNFFFRES